MARELHQVVHELVIEDRSAGGAQQAITGLRGIETASDRAKVATQGTATGLGRLGEAMAQSARAQGDAQRALDRWKAAADPAERAVQQLARAERDLDRAIQHGKSNEQEKIRILGQLRERTLGAASANDNYQRSLAGTTGPMSAFTSGIGSMMGRLGGALAILVSVRQAIRGLQAVIDKTSEFEQSQLRLEGVLRATGNAAGQSIEGLLAFADQLDRSTLTSRNAVLDAAAALATFRSVSGDTFTRAIELGQDMSAVFGGELQSSVTQLGKALEDPIQGLTALRRVGVTFSQDQRDLIATLVETGRVAEAQTEILNALEAQLGGAGAAEAGGVAGATDNLDRALDRLAIGFGQATGMTGGFIASQNRVAQMADIATAALTTQAGALQGLAAVMALTGRLVPIGGEEIQSHVAALTAWSRALRTVQREIADEGGVVLDLEDPPAIVPPARGGRATTDDFSKVLADLAAAGNATQDSWTKSNRSLGDYLTGLEEANRLAGLSTEEREIEEAIMRAQNLLVDAQGNKTRDLNVTERERIETAIRTGNAIEANQRRAEEMEKAVERVTDDVVDFAAKGFIEFDDDVLADPEIAADVAAALA